MSELNNYYYDGLEGEMSPEECKEYFLESPIEDWLYNEDCWRSKTHTAVHVVHVGKQVLYYQDTPVAYVVITPEARGIWKNIPVDIVSMEESSDE